MKQTSYPSGEVEPEVTFVIGWVLDVQGTVDVHKNTDCLLKNMSTNHNKSVINRKHEHFDDEENILLKSDIF
jgi:hypothetical protein